MLRPRCQRAIETGQLAESSKAAAVTRAVKDDPSAGSHSSRRYCARVTSEGSTYRPTLIVLQTVTVSENGYQPEGDQKSDGSARTIHLDARVVAALRRQRAEQAAIRLEVGPAWNDQGLVFPREDGAWWNPNSLTSAFTRAVKAAGLPRIRLHDLLHIHATLLLAAGVNPKVVSERLGHSSVASRWTPMRTFCPACSPRPRRCFSTSCWGLICPTNRPLRRLPRCGRNPRDRRLGSVWDQWSPSRQGPRGSATR